MTDFVGELLLLTAVGNSQHGDVAAAVAAAIAAPDRPVLRGVLFDGRLSTSLATRTSVQIRAVADDLTRLASHFGARIALVATNDLAYGLLRIGDAHMQGAGLDSCVFRTPTDALAWLIAPGET